MNRKLVYWVFFFVICALLTQQITYAQTPGLLPSVNSTCGDPQGVGDAQKCCKSTIVTPAPVDLGNGLLNAGRDIIQPLIDKQTNAMIKQQKSIDVKPCIEGVLSTPGDPNNNSCICLVEPTKSPISAFESMCNAIKTPSEYALCLDCSHNKAGVWTAMGCFNGNLSEFISNNIMKTSIGFAGGISLLCIMFAAFQMQTSGGNAEKVKKAQEMMTNCITGLMVIIFSILILKIIGVDILRIPGFN